MEVKDSEQGPSKRQKMDSPEVPALAIEVNGRIEVIANKALLPPEGYSYENVSVMRGNAMKYLPNFFEKGQVCCRLLPLRNHCFPALLPLPYTRKD